MQLRSRIAFLLAIAPSSVAWAQIAAGPLNETASPPPRPVPAHEHKKAQTGVPSAKSGSTHAKISNAPSVDAQTFASPSPVMHRAPIHSENGPSFGFRWRATNDKIDPYDAVNHEAGPNGQGAAVEGGLKFGF